MLATAVRNVLIRDLEGLSCQVEAYPDDRLLWKLAPGISNSGGTLVLHVTGNLRHYVGAVLGGTGYVRDRDAEFSSRGIPRAVLLEGIEAARRSVHETLTGLEPEQLAVRYPERVGGQSLRVGDFLVHLATHSGYHLGQVDYHRRLIAPGAGPLGMVPAGGLPPFPPDREP